MAWQDELPEGLVVDNADGSKIMLRDHPFVAESPDAGHFVLKAFNQHRELGSRIPVKKYEKPEEVENWRKEHLPRLYDNGLLPKPPASPDEYGIKRPENLKDGLTWNDEIGKSYAATLHKYGIPKEAASELLALHEQAVLGAQKFLKTSFDDGMAALKAEHGDKFDERREVTKRLIKDIFKTPEEEALFNASGMGDHPNFLSVMMRLAPLAQQDSSYMKDITTNATGQQMSADEIRAKVADVRNNQQNPLHKGYWANDPEVFKQIDAWYKQAYGDGKYIIS